MFFKFIHKTLAADIHAVLKSLLHASLVALASSYSTTHEMAMMSSCFWCSLALMEPPSAKATWSSLCSTLSLRRSASRSRLVTYGQGRTRDQQDVNHPPHKQMQVQATLRNKVREEKMEGSRQRVYCGKVKLSLCLTIRRIGERRYRPTHSWPRH